MEIPMTPELLDALIRAGESLSVEFKGEEHEALNDREMVEAVVCVANRPAEEERGYLIVGVEDDGRVTGARPRHEAGQTDPRCGQALIANRTQPALTCRVEMGILARQPALVADLCRLSGPQAYRVLRRLVAKGALTAPAGRGRSVRYEKTHAYRHERPDRYTRAF
jgi:predicted HTH transcriptional regulator